MRILFTRPFKSSFSFIQLKEDPNADFLLTNVISENISLIDAFKDRVDCMESAGREPFLDSDIIHLSIHDAVLHAQKMLRKVKF